MRIRNRRPKLTKFGTLLFTEFYYNMKAKLAKSKIYMMETVRYIIKKNLIRTVPYKTP